MHVLFLVSNQLAIGAAQLRSALITAFSRLPAQLRRSLTWDQGKEMVPHAEITAALGMPVYFCEKASPWQRGSNENINGPLHQYSPKRQRPARAQRGRTGRRRRRAECPGARLWPGTPPPRGWACELLAHRAAGRPKLG